MALENLMPRPNRSIVNAGIIILLFVGAGLIFAAILYIVFYGTSPVYALQTVLSDSISFLAIGGGLLAIAGYLISRRRSVN